LPFQGNVSKLKKVMPEGTILFQFAITVPSTFKALEAGVLYLNNPVLPVAYLRHAIHHFVLFSTHMMLLTEHLGLVLPGYRTRKKFPEAV
jgi:hypothetical protein